MNIKHFVKSTITALLGIIVSFSISAQNNTISVVTEVLQPYQYIDKNNTPEGYSIDVIEQLLSQSNLKSDIEFFPWIRAYDKAANGKNKIILTIARTAEREDQFHWIGSIHNEIFSFYALKSNQNIKAVSTVEDLKNYSIVVTKNSVLDRYLISHNIPTVERSIDVEQTYKMLYKNRVDLIFKSHTSIKTQTNNFGYDYKMLKEVFLVPDLSADLHIAISKNSAPALVKTLKTNFDDMIKSGELSALKKKWGVEVNSGTLN